MIEGFVYISMFILDSEGRVKIKSPLSVENKSGVIAILSNSNLCYLSATKHYGPRIRDFMHAISGETNSARIHRNIKNELVSGNTVEIMVKDCVYPGEIKKDLIRKYKPIWNRK